MTARASVRKPLLAVAITLIMVTSGIAILGFFSPSQVAPPATPRGGASWLSPLVVQSGQQLQSDPVSTLAGAPLSNLPNATVLGPAPANYDTWFTVGYPLQNESELANIIAEQGTPGSPLYHHWLTTGQETTMFGADPALVQNTVNYFTSLGFTVGTVGPISVSFHAPASRVNAAFHTTLSNVRYGNQLAPNYTIANSAPLQLPAPISSGVGSVDGLSGPGGYRYFHSLDPTFVAAMQADAAIQSGAASAPPPVSPTVVPCCNATIADLYNYTAGAYGWFGFKSHFQSIALTKRYQTLSAATLNPLYNANPLLAQGYTGNWTGHPINIAIVMEGGINPGDMAAYSTLVYNNPNQVVNRIHPVPIDGAYTWNGTLYYTDGASGEMALDIEFSSTMSPGAQIYPVYAQGFFGNMLDDQYASLFTMTPQPNIISNSWGGGEDIPGTLYVPGIGNDLVMHHYFMLLDAKGSSILASSGDGGGFDGTTGILSASFPASDPYVLSVDGLRTSAMDRYGQLFPTSNLSYGLAQTFIPLINQRRPGLGVNVNVFETRAAGLHDQSYWYTPIINFSLYTGPPAGSGGFGISSWYQQPFWQHAPGVPDVGRSLGSGVAAEADFNQSIFFDGVPNFLYGGTSFACPTVAGMWADIESYLQAHGKSTMLGNLNQPVWQIGNAWLNGNLNLTPYYDVNNGTSFWGNHGADHQYAWPPGQNFPMNAGGTSTYGNTVPGWDFPTGWGSMNVWNFAVDLNQLEGESGFFTVNSTSNTFTVNQWTAMTLNQTYAVDVNATASIAAANPVVTVEFFPEAGAKQSWTVSGGALVQVLTPAPGLRFTLNTGIAPFAPNFSPGLVVFVLATTGNPNVGFGYNWIAPRILPGPLTVTVQNPGSGSIVGGCATANLDEPLGSFAPDVGGGGLGCAAYNPAGAAYLYENTFDVRVTNAAGKGVYNAIVTAQIPQLNDLAWVGSLAELHAAFQGRSVSMPTTIVSETFSNLTGYALVQTWTMTKSTPYFVNATYGPESGGTIFTVRPPENLRPLGVDNGKYAQFNAEDIQLYIERQAYNNATLDRYIPNFTNQTGLYSDLYGWQGQVLHLHVNNYTGASVSGRQVWLGSYDSGREYRFTRYEPTAGVAGITNSSGTVGYTDSNGNVAITIPDNMSDRNFWGYLAPAPMGIGAIAVNIPGTSNQTFQYNELCAPHNFSNPAPLITCQFNNSYYRNYTATPLWILPNPLNVTTMTPQHVRRDFFGTGTNISFLLNISLPTMDPIGYWYFVPNGYNGNPLQWSSGLEHVTGVTAYVDGNYAGNITPEEPPQVQFWAQYANLSGNYTPGIHELTVYVTTSLGQEFSFTHRFIVGAIVNENLNDANLYTPLPYPLSWSVNIPAGQISNVTFNSSLEISYVSSGCGITGACQVVNYSIKVHPHQTNYNQSINSTLLNLDGFYAGDHGSLPPGQYKVIVWFNANHSGSARQSVTTYFVFDPLQGQITGPTATALVPLGNVTIAYTYQGGYITNATLEVFQNFSDGTNELVYTQLAFIPAIGSQARTGSATWTAVSTGPFWIAIVLGAPYAPFTYTSGEKIQVINTNPPTQITHSNGYPPLFNVDPAGLSTALALAAGIIGLLLGLWVAPVLRPAKEGAGSPAKAWDAGSGKAVDISSTECSICHERFETGIGLQQHRRIVHGIEE